MNIKWFVVLSVLAVLVTGALMLWHSVEAAEVAALISVAFAIISLHDRD